MVRTVEGKLTPARDAVLSKIPAFPPIVLKVLDLTACDDVEMGELAELISSDAVFVAQALRLANSALFNHLEPISSLKHALVTLGLERVQGLAATIATSNYLKAALRLEELRRCWRHTFACAISCREIARAAGMPEDKAYTQGLLHDIGRLGLLVASPNEYAQMLRDADRDTLSLLDLEQQRFGMDHCEVGRHLAEKWNLPQDFAVTLGRHHDPPDGGEFDSLSVIYHGCRLADALGFPVHKPLKPPTYEEVLAELPGAVAGRMPADGIQLAEQVAAQILQHDSNRTVTPVAVHRHPNVPEEEPEPEVEIPPRDLVVATMTAGVIMAALLLTIYLSGWSGF